jgi:antitoxin MazE
VKVTVAKWGNSTAVRLPKSVSEDLNLEAGVQLDLVIKDGGILLSLPAKPSKQLLAEMLAEAKRLGPGFEPDTVDWGPDRGSEIVDDNDPR